MRLLRTADRTLHEFFGREIPKYAILSHRWEDSGEVTFKDMKKGKAERMKGFTKIRACCSRAADDGWKYVWIDTCCIDKKSSAELSEAIVSMFSWYRNAEICYAYLSDVPAGLSKESHRKGASHFAKSKWFTRGWTLQELLAPKEIVFFDQKWSEIGLKSELTVSLSAITGIHHLDNFETASVAQKMSWVSRRQTKRIEDLAYCMVGIFGVHMPPLYGEGSNAFLRLQLEILKISDDESLFAWQADEASGARYSERGMLAWHPKEFQYSGSIERDEFRGGPPFHMTNKGLCVELEIIIQNHVLRPDYSRLKDNSHLAIHHAFLNCKMAGSRIGIFLKLRQTRIGGESFIRTCPHILLAPLVDDGYTVYSLKELDRSMVYIPQPTFSAPSDDSFSIRILPFPLEIRESLKYIFLTMPDSDSWHEMRPYEFQLSLNKKGACVLAYQQSHMEDLFVIITTLNGLPVLRVAKLKESNTTNDSDWDDMFDEYQLVVDDKMSHPGHNQHEAIMQLTDALYNCDMTFRVALTRVTSEMGDESELCYSMQTSMEIRDAINDMAIDG